MLNDIVKRPLLWVMLYGALIAYGIYALLNIHAEVLPQFNMPQVSVVAQLPGATTLDLEGLIARPVEAELSSLASLSDVRTVIGQGSVKIEARFSEGTSPASALQDVNGVIGRINSSLPKGTNLTTEISGNAINEVADYAIQIPDGVDASQIQRIVESNFAPRIRAVAGVQRVSVAGPGADAIWVRPDLAKLQRFNVSASALTTSLDAATAMVPSGYVNLGHQDVFMEGRSLPTSPSDYARVLVGNPGATLPLGAVAEVLRSALPFHHSVKLDNRPTIALVVFKQPGASTLPVVDEVDKTLQELEPQLPAGARFVRIYSQGHIVGVVASDLTRNLAIGAVLAVAVLFWMLGASRGIWALALSIPLSLLLGIAGLYLMGQTLNLLTFGALSVAVGLLADDAIIVLESIYHRWEAGDGRWEGVARGLRDIAGPDISGTMTTVAVFLPLVFVGGLAGLFFVPFSVAMTVSLVASLLISLSLIPLVLGFIGPHVEKRATSGSRAVAWLKGRNLHLFEFALRRPRVSLWSCVAIFAVSVAGLVLVPVDFLPLPNEAVLLESFTLPPGTSLHDAQDASDRITQRLISLPPVAHVFSRVGSASGTSYTEPAYAGEIQIALKPNVNASSLDKVGKQVLEASKLPAVQTIIGTPTLERVGETLSGLPQPFVIDVYGDSIEALQSLSNEVTHRLSGVSDLSDVFNNDAYPVTELQITPNPDGLALHGITPAQLFSQLHILLAGQTVASVPEGNGHLDVFVRLADPTHLSIEQLNQLPVMANGWVALKDVAYVHMATGPNVIRHLNGLRAVEILATPTAPLGQVISASRKALATLPLPAGYEVRFGGLYPQLEHAALNVGVAAVVAFALMLGILTLQFDGLLVPGLLLLQMPLAFSGGAIALVVSGVGLNAIGLIAFLTLIGVSLNHGIVLLQLVKRNEAQGLSVVDAVRDAVDVRFRPILLTVLTASLGLLPTALGFGKGAAPEQGLAIVTLGGLIWSGLLSTNLLPALYVYKRERQLRKASQRR
ncbi:efflux RND transporter permease subunit [Paraburkholderia susongensis]|uniref:Cobalt-zinc-cadmium resistance protein CzcA n=1 Tax=Paraburkholderia susongensis TaxID=1515439 RepID=A0A1X7KFH7_9BURK|nr:efflux RND transporter permease subunit [Paraburkholderia susongensis]SMG39694.1 cobalt-zinc-cadmium resistance protein CzcA [Paraburkholderia susongensis]